LLSLFQLSKPFMSQILKILGLSNCDAVRHGKAFAMKGPSYFYTHENTKVS
jgi:hypothetical protein